MCDLTPNDLTTGWPQRLTIDFHAGLPIEAIADILLPAITEQLQHSAGATITAIHILQRPPEDW